MVGRVASYPGSASVPRRGRAEGNGCKLCLAFLRVARSGYVTASRPSGSAFGSRSRHLARDPDLWLTDGHVAILSVSSSSRFVCISSLPVKQRCTTLVPLSRSQVVLDPRLKRLRKVI